MTIPISRTEQLIAVRKTITEQVLLTPEALQNSGRAQPDPLKVLVPFFEPQEKHVYMLDVMRASWAKEQLKGCHILGHVFSQHPVQNEAGLLAITRTNRAAQFWLDTVAWLFQARRAVVLDLNELKEQVTLAAQEIGAHDRGERFVQHIDSIVAPVDLSVYQEPVYTPQRMRG